MNMDLLALIVNLVAALLLAPLTIGLVNKTKAVFAGRHGASVFQLYFDLAKYLRKSSPRSASSTWIFDLAPSVSLVATLLGTGLIISGTSALPPPSSLVLLFFLGFYFLGTARFFAVLGARDVASVFPDMGSAREVQFSAIAEAVLFAVLAYVAVGQGGTPPAVPRILAAGAAFVVLLSENCRVPFDDPETHLELTMIHEAMILDNAGPDLAFILYGAALKLWAFSAFLCGLCGLAGWALPAGVLALGLVLGAVESSMARMRFKKTPFVLASAFALAVLALVLEVLH